VRTVTRGLFVAFGTTAVLQAQVAAQSTAPSAAPGTSVVRGHVTTADSARAPLAGVEVAIPSLGRAVRADAGGAFVLDALPAGTHALIARRVGFDSVMRLVTLSGAGDTATLALALAPRITTLSKVEVRDSAARSAVVLRRAFERERALAHGGTFVDDTLLARQEHSVLSTLLRRVPGVSLVRYQERGRSYMALGSRRGGTAVAATNPNCFYQIFLDGGRIFAPTARNDEPPPDIDQFRIADLEGVEIYRGTARTPPQFVGTGAACGTVLFWSRQGR
jgi:hypothetical protein